MKITKILIVLILVGTSLISQDFNHLADYEFETIESYQSEKNNVLICANYLFNNPANESDVKRLISIQYIMKWMTGTPDYTFEIGDSVMKLVKGNNDLLGLYIAALSKIALENERETITSKAMHDEAVKILADYCSESENKMKPSKELKKIIKQNRKKN